jgi:hypothetical protein
LDLFVCLFGGEWRIARTNLAWQRRIAQLNLAQSLGNGASHGSTSLGNGASDSSTPLQRKTLNVLETESLTQLRNYLRGAMRPLALVAGVRASPSPFERVSLWRGWLFLERVKFVARKTLSS